MSQTEHAGKRKAPKWPVVVTVIVMALTYLGIGSVGQTSWYGWIASYAPYSLFGVFMLLLIGWAAVTLFQIASMGDDAETAAVAIEKWEDEETPETLRGLLDGRLLRSTVDGEETHLSQIAHSADRTSLLHSLGAWWSAGRRQLAATFTGLGIVFTFYGLIHGLEGSNLQAVAEGGSGLAALDLQGLLNNVGLAFRSSFVGVSCSILFAVVLRVFDSHLDRAASRLRDAAADRDWREAPGEMLKKSDEKLRFINQRARRLVDLSEDQNAKLGTLGSDIKSAFETVLSEQLEAHVGSQLSALDEKLGDFTEAQVDTQQEAMAAALESFQEQFSENLTDQFEELRATLQTTIEAQRKNQQLFERAVEKAEDAVSRLESHEANLASLTDRREEILESHTRMAAEREERMSDSIEQLENNEEALEAWSDQMSEQFSELKPLIDRTQTVSTNLEHGVELLEKVEQKIQESLERASATFERAPEKFEESVRVAHDELDAGLRETFEMFDDETAQIAKHLSGTHTETKSTLEELRDLTGDLTEALDRQSRTLQAVTQQLQQIAAGAQSGERTE